VVFQDARFHAVRRRLLSRLGVEAPAPQSAPAPALVAFPTGEVVL
jgi:sulfonate transport system ATP-binding protein